MTSRTHNDGHKPMNTSNMMTIFNAATLACTVTHALAQAYFLEPLACLEARANFLLVSSSLYPLLDSFTFRRKSLTCSKEPSLRVPGSRVLSRLDGGGSISYTGAVGAGGKQPSHLVDDGDAHNDAHNDTHEGTQLEVDVEDARATKQGRCLGLWWVLRGLRLVARDARLRLLTSCYALNMAANGGLLVALISMLELPISEGGLGLSTQMAGGAMAWFGGAGAARARGAPPAGMFDEVY